MTVAADTLALLRPAFAGRPVPRVRALHLPPLEWNGSKSGEFAALELEGGTMGLAYVLLGDTLPALAASALPRTLPGTEALALAARADAADALERTLGFAALNALTRAVFDRAGYAPPPAWDSIAGLDPQPGEAVGMVGYFPPLVRPLTARGARLVVLERRPEMAGEREGFRITLDPEALGGCTQVLCTSTVLLNDTLDAVLARCAAARRFALVGPGASLLPEALFARGVTTLAGAWIEDDAGLQTALASGTPWGASVRKFTLSRADYPGLSALLDGSRP